MLISSIDGEMSDLNQEIKELKNTLVNQTISVWSGFSWRAAEWAAGIYLGGLLGYTELPKDCKMANN